jgi:GNAT superfamily N-acetyltransferase
MGVSLLPVASNAVTDGFRTLVASDIADRGVFDTIFQALDDASRDALGPARGRLLVVPWRDQAGKVAGGFWGVTVFRWLQVEMLFVPAGVRGRGVGSALMAVAESEARARSCIGIHVDAFSFQAAAFYRKLGFSVFGVLEDCPPGQQRLFLHKRLT